MSKKTGIVVLLAVLLTFGLVWVMPDGTTPETASEAERNAPARTDRRVERTNEGRVLRVVEDTGTAVLRYSVDAFNTWTKSHWDEVFAERPSFGKIREVDFAGFRQFDRGAALSPQGDVLAFSVSDYAAATTLSFVAFLDVETDTVALVDAANRGEIAKLRWSPGGRYVAYCLHTARAHGDGLSVDRAHPPEEMVSLTGADVLAALDRAGEPTPSSFRPAFEDLTWTDEGRLSVRSRSPNGGTVQWLLKVTDGTLEQIK